MKAAIQTNRQDIYTRVTDAIIADIEQGVRPWLKPWNAEHAAGRINRPLRAGGQPYKGINVLMLWTSAMGQGFAAPIWMTFKQAKELGAYVKKGAKGSLVVYADRITRTETGEDGEEIERDIPYMKGYTVFNVEQIEGLPDHYYAVAAPRSTRCSGSSMPTASSPTRGPTSATAGTRPITPRSRITCRCRPSSPSATPKLTVRRWPTN